jgi:hypothetical protein
MVLSEDVGGVWDCEGTGEGEARDAPHQEKTFRTLTATENHSSNQESQQK